MGSGLMQRAVPGPSVVGGGRNIPVFSTGRAAKSQKSSKGWRGQAQRLGTLPCVGWQYSGATWGLASALRGHSSSRCKNACLGLVSPGRPAWLGQTHCLPWGPRSKATLLVFWKSLLPKPPSLERMCGEVGRGLWAKQLGVKHRGQFHSGGRRQALGVGGEHGILLLPQLAAPHTQGHVRRHPEPG